MKLEFKLLSLIVVLKLKHSVFCRDTDLRFTEDMARLKSFNKNPLRLFTKNISGVLVKSDVTVFDSDKNGAKKRYDTLKQRAAHAQKNKSSESLLLEALVGTTMRPPTEENLSNENTDTRPQAATTQDYRDNFEEDYGGQFAFGVSRLQNHNSNVRADVGDYQEVFSHTNPNYEAQNENTNVRAKRSSPKAVPRSGHRNKQIIQQINKQIKDNDFWTRKEHKLFEVLPVFSEKRKIENIKRFFYPKPSPWNDNTYDSIY